MGKVFISHSSRDKYYVDKICEHLDRNGIEYWVAHEGIAPGIDYRQVISELIPSPECSQVLLILTYNSLVSAEVDIEITMARDYEKFISVYKIHGIDYRRAQSGLLYNIRYIQAIDAVTGPFEESNLNALVFQLGKGTASINTYEKFVLSLKGLKESENVNKENASFHAEWGETLLKFHDFLLGLAESLHKSWEDVLREIFSDTFTKQTELLSAGIDQYNEAVSIGANTSTCFENLAYLYSKQADINHDVSLYPQSFDSYQKAIALEPDGFNIKWDCVRMLSDWFKKERNRTELIKIIYTYYSDIEEKITIGKVALYIEWADFIIQSEHINGARPENAVGSKNTAYYKECSRLYRKALSVGGRSEEIRIKWNEMFRNWSGELQIKGELQGLFYDITDYSAIPQVKQAAELLSELAAMNLLYAQIMRADTRADMSNTEDAAILVDKAISIYEQLSRIFYVKADNNLFAAYANKSVLLKDEETFNYALTLQDPNDSADAYNIGLLYYEWADIVGESKKQEYLEKAISFFDAIEHFEELDRSAINTSGKACLRLADLKNHDDRLLKKAMSFFKLKRSLSYE